MADESSIPLADRPRATRIAPDGARDRRIEDFSNLYLVHAAARALLPATLRLGLSANMVSLIGLALGVAAAACYARWDSAWLATLGFALSIGWMIADGLDGMVARATSSTSPAGRFLDGVCDHAVFILIYVALATSIGTAEGWALAIAAGVAHAVQSSLYEGERARFHRRAKGDARPGPPMVAGNPLVRVYDWLAGSLDRIARPFERRMARDADPATFGRAYARDAVASLRWMTLLSANVRVAAIFAASLAGDPTLFWLFEILVLSPILAATIAAHRGVERRYAALPLSHPPAPPFAGAITKD